MSHLKLVGIIGQSIEIKHIFSMVEKIAGSDSTILITGETGTGKGLIARAIHQNSNRADRPFVSINCGALPESLLERLVVLKQAGWLQPADLPTKIRGIQKSIITPPTKEITGDGIGLATAVTEYEKALILQSLEKAKWVKNKAAKLLHLNRTTLVEKIKRYELTPSDARSNA